MRKCSGPNPKIERSYMDGSDRKSIIFKGITWPNGLAIDYAGKKIYWADAKQHVVECSNFDGSNRVKVSGNLYILAFYGGYFNS